ncbi:MAG TPA: AarF/UbiB family protein [Anaeromyxobacteraceae bacterium]|nr:AarF/UbiB family protein [Anaeromyxobacteraceae bacterium]
MAGGGGGARRQGLPAARADGAGAAGGSLDRPGPPRDVAGRCRGRRFYLGSLFRHGLFNWDPHPGNYIVQPDGRIAMLDHGSTRELDGAFVRKLAALAQAVHADERPALERALLDLEMIRPGDARQLDTARDLVRAFHGPMLRDEVLSFQLGTLAPFRSIVSTKREILRLHIPGEMLFVLRIRFGLMSVLARLGARGNWSRLERRYAADALAAAGE